MLTLLFEDRLVVDNERYIGLSYLLKQACNNILRCEVEFSETNCALLEKAGSIIGDGQKVMAFLDVVIDNKNSTQLYQQCIKTLVSEKITDIILLPIPCIEFYFISAFRSLVSDAYIVKQMLELQPTGNFKLNGGTAKSFEKVCKRILSGYTPVDVCNSSFYKTKLSFYNGYYGIKDEPVNYMDKCQMFLSEILNPENNLTVKDLLVELTEQIKVQVKQYELTLSPIKRECTNFEYLEWQKAYVHFMQENAYELLDIKLYGLFRRKSTDLQSLNF